MHSPAKAHAKSLNGLTSVPGCSLIASSTGRSFSGVENGGVLLLVVMVDEAVLVAEAEVVLI